MHPPWLKFTLAVALGGLPLAAVGARASLQLTKPDQLNDRPLPAAVHAAVVNGLAMATPRNRSEVESYASAVLQEAPADADDETLARLYASAFNAAASFASLPDHAHVMSSHATLWGLTLGELAWVHVPSSHVTEPLDMSPKLALSGIGGSVAVNLD
jgi:hypothetical protein